MKFVLFYHSLVSDWNHGNAHFLRGVATELLARGHQLAIYEPEDSWSVANLRAEHGEAPIADFHAAYPELSSTRYRLDEINLEHALKDADVVIAHEWSDHDLVRRLGELRAQTSHFRLLFHDTHHRAITARGEMEKYDLRHFDGVLAYGEVLRRVYLEAGWTRRAWTWHEAADTRVFRPRPKIAPTRDLVWIGNWGDGERSRELQEFLIEPVRALGLSATVHGVRYPEHARTALADAGIAYRGWLPNFRAPEVFAQHRVTIHVPRGPYVQSLRGIPTIRPFEALACGIPMISAPWEDAEHLFTPGEDYLVASDGQQMRDQLRRILRDSDFARRLAERGRCTIDQRHTCAHRVEELLGICSELSAS